MAVPKGHIEAATAFGFTRGQVFRRIMFPSMMRYALPHWQQLAGDPQIYRTGFVTRPEDVVKATQLAGKSTGTVLFRHRLWRDLLVFTTVSNGVLLFLERRYSVGVKRADL